jgi:predicted nuclease of predicted toxin-antitoxin system
MQILIDQNISARLIEALKLVNLPAAHVSHIQLSRSTDREIWDFAKQNSMTILTKDSDFNDLSTLYGVPPKIIHLRIGNCTTQEIIDLLLAKRAEILKFLGDDHAGILTLFSGHK